MNGVDLGGAGFTEGLFWEISVPLTVVVLLTVWALLKFKRSLRRSLRSMVRGFVMKVVRLGRA
jgi:hypothetical protein